MTPAAAATAAVAIGRTTDFVPLRLAPRVSLAGCLERASCRALLEVADFEPADFDRVGFEFPDLALVDFLALVDLALVDLALVDRLVPLRDFALLPLLLLARDDPLDDDFRWVLGAVLLGDERALA